MNHSFLSRIRIAVLGWIFTLGLIFSFGISCTTIGFHEGKLRANMDFGEMQAFRVCTFYEEGILPDDIQELFDFWNRELSLYNLSAISVRQTMVKRPGFTGFDIIDFLYRQPLRKECDRLLYLKGRTAGDIVYEVVSLGVFAGLGFKFEMQGAVDSITHTRGYIKAKYISTFQLLFSSPESTLVHEGYHLLGCGHQIFMKPCYDQILKLKKLNHHPLKEEGFFPSLNEKGTEFIDRNQIEHALSTD